ncbi:MAG: cytochrome c maturation protein CcmE [Armatimonadetes bacterium]|nr:cytochrome c maturation protein CcmE [Armatimonadota bacterium]
MKSGTLISLLVASVAVVGLGFVFVQNSSPYLTINQLSKTSQGVHVVGKIVPGSLKENPMQRETRFKISDDTGQMDVLYNGPTLANLAVAKQVVVVGSMDATQFKSDQMLVKCPSKYESNKKAEAQ